jgi:cell division protein FtsB
VIRRLLVWAAVLFAVYYAVQGGEYSTVDLVRQRSREAMLQRAIDSLQQSIDSLESLRKRVQRDPALQERIARETFGMVRGDDELLYRFVDPDSVPARDSARRSAPR